MKRAVLASLPAVLLCTLARAEPDADSATRAQEIAALRADHAVMRVALSAQICVSNENLANAASEKKRWAAAAGVHDREREAKVEQWMKDDQASIKNARAELKRRKLKPQACTDPLVRDVGRCLHDDSARACGNGAEKFVLALRGE